MLRASSKVGIRPPNQAAQPASSSYEAMTGQLRASRRGTGPKTVRTDVSLMKEVADEPMGAMLLNPFATSIPFEEDETQVAGMVLILEEIKYETYWGEC